MTDGELNYAYNEAENIGNVPGMFGCQPWLIRVKHPIQTYWPKIDLARSQRVKGAQRKITQWILRCSDEDACSSKGALCYRTSPDFGHASPDGTTALQMPGGRIASPRHRIEFVPRSTRGSSREGCFTGSHDFMSVQISSCSSPSHNDGNKTQKSLYT